MFDAKYSNFLNASLLYFNKHFLLRNVSNERPIVNIYNDPDILEYERDMLFYQNLSYNIPEYKNVHESYKQRYKDLIKQKK